MYRVCPLRPDTPDGQGRVMQPELYISRVRMYVSCMEAFTGCGASSDSEVK